VGEALADATEPPVRGQ